MGPIDLQALSNNLKLFAQEGTSFIYIVAMVAGIVFVVLALQGLVSKGKSDGMHQDKSWGAIGGRLLIASCLITLANKLNMIVETNGSTEPLRQALAYAQGTTAGGTGGGSMPALIWAAISAWAVFMGTAGFMRGFLLFDKASQGGQDSGDSFWRGLWHVIGGAICVNIFS